MILNNININKPISAKNAKDLLLNTHEIRQTFLREYDYFESDGHKHIYAEIVEQFLQSKDSVLIADAIDLASYVGGLSDKFLNRFCSILIHKSSNVVKRSVLFYLLENVELMDKIMYIGIHKKVIKEKKTALIRMMAYTNLCYYDITYSSFILRILKREKNEILYRNFFYQLDSSSMKKRKESISNLIVTIAEEMSSNQFEGISQETCTLFYEIKKEYLN